jgi:DegV family protein with EDD domain
VANIRIVTDSTADIPESVRKQYGIEMVPLKVHFGTETYLDSVTIQADEFYEKLKSAASLPTTSQPSPADFLNVYKRLIGEQPGAQIISIHLSSAMSGTYQSAVLAESMLEGEADISVVDSKSASYGFGMLVVEAAKAAQEGKSKEEILELITNIRNNTRIYFLVDTLEYLQKGGRIGKAAALFGSLLNIKPILTIDSDGEVSSVDKVRGQKKAMGRIVELLKEEFGERELALTIASSAEPKTEEEFSQLLRDHFRVRDITYTKIGPVIGTHAGPGTIAAFAVPVS